MGKRTVAAVCMQLARSDRRKDAAFASVAQAARLLSCSSNVAVRVLLCVFVLRSPSTRGM